MLSSGDLGFASSSAQYSLASQSPNAISKSARSSSVFGTTHAPLHVPATTAFAGPAGPSEALVAGGRSMTFSGDTDPLIPSGMTHVVDSYTSVISHITSAPSVVVFGFETLFYTSGSSNITISSQTLIPGASAITVAGETVSLSSSNGAIVVNGQTTQLPAIANGAEHTEHTENLTFGDQALRYSIGTDGALVMDSQTVVPGLSAVTISGQTISISYSSGIVFINGQSTRLTAVDGALLTGALSLDNLVLGYTARSSGQLIFGSQTLTAGGNAVIVSGEIISLPTGSAGRSDIVINGQVTTLLLSPAPTGAPSRHYGWSSVYVQSHRVISTYYRWTDPYAWRFSHHSLWKDHFAPTHGIRPCCHLCGRHGLWKIGFFYHQWA